MVAKSQAIRRKISMSAAPLPPNAAHAFCAFIGVYDSGRNVFANTRNRRLSDGASRTDARPEGKER